LSLVSAYRRVSAFIGIHRRSSAANMGFDFASSCKEIPRRVVHLSVIGGNKRVISHDPLQVQVAAGGETRYLCGSMAWS
jgi:hypothetical protein